MASNPAGDRSHTCGLASPSHHKLACETTALRLSPECAPLGLCMRPALPNGKDPPKGYTRPNQTLLHEPALLAERAAARAGRKRASTKDSLIANIFTHQQAPPLLASDPAGDRSHTCGLAIPLHHRLAGETTALRLSPECGPTGALRRFAKRSGANSPAARGWAAFAIESQHFFLMHNL